MATAKQLIEQKLIGSNLNEVVSPAAGIQDIYTALTMLGSRARAIEAYGANEPYAKSLQAARYKMQDAAALIASAFKSIK